MVAVTEDVAVCCFWGPEYEQRESLAFDSKAMAVQSHSFCLHRVLYPQFLSPQGHLSLNTFSPFYCICHQSYGYEKKKGGNIFEKSTKWIRQGLTCSEAGGLVTGWGARLRERDQLSWAGVTHCHGVCEVPLRSSESNRVVQEV